MALHGEWTAVTADYSGLEFFDVSMIVYCNICSCYSFILYLIWKLFFQLRSAITQFRREYINTVEVYNFNIEQMEKNMVRIQSVKLIETLHKTAFLIRKLEYISFRSSRKKTSLEFLAELLSQVFLF